MGRNAECVMTKTTDFSKVDRLVDSSMRKGLTSLGNDVRSRSRVLAPRLSGDLVRSARVDVSTNPDKVVIGYYVPYAAIRSRINNKHPATRNYLPNALKSITSLAPYFKEEF